jgi:hypothetical protein
MKLRIKGNSLRLRVSRSEVQRLVDIGRVKETIQLGLDRAARITYALEHAPVSHEITVHHQAQEITVVLSSESTRRWADSPEEVGLYGRLDVYNGELIVSVETDLACLDGSVAENEDTFPNPNRGATC